MMVYEREAKYGFQKIDVNTIWAEPQATIDVALGSI